MRLVAGGVVERIAHPVDERQLACGSLPRCPLAVRGSQGNDILRRLPLDAGLAAGAGSLSSSSHIHIYRKYSRETLIMKANSFDFDLNSNTISIDEH